jgi:ABC-type nitrate/sulfonate/bicarbonate transport system substrate-binding protein
MVARSTPVQLNVVTSGQTGSMSGLWTAAEAGYFQDEGLDVQFTTVDGSARAIPLLLSGEAQFSSVDARNLIEADLKGADLRAVAAVTNRLMYSIMVDPSIKTPDDLRGRRIGITTLGSGAGDATVQALKIWKLEPDRDVGLVPLSNQPNILAGMQARQVDAGVLASPTTARAKLSGFQELINLATDGPDYASLTIGSTQSFLNQNPQTALAFLRAYSRALHRYKTDQAIGIQAMGHYLQLNDRAVLADTWNEFAPVFEDVPYVSEHGLKNVIDSVAQNLPEAMGAMPDRFVDSSFVRQLEGSGFYSRLQAGS